MCYIYGSISTLYFSTWLKWHKKSVHYLYQFINKFNCFSNQLTSYFITNSFYFPNGRFFFTKTFNSYFSFTVPPLLQMHGDIDDLVPIEWGQTTFKQLTNLGVQGDFHILNRLGHSINKQGMRIIKEWIEKHLPEIWFVFRYVHTKYIIIILLLHSVPFRSLLLRDNGFAERHQRNPGLLAVDHGNKSNLS